MTVKTVELQSTKLSPKECKSCGEPATLQSYDVNCKKCHREGRRLAKWFISLPKPTPTIEDLLGY